MKFRSYNLKQPRKKPSNSKPMKTFATLALMAVAACAVDMQTEDRYTNLYQGQAPAPSNNVQVAEKEVEHEHDENVVHVDVWETIDTELAELMNEVMALMTAVDTQGNTLMTA